MEDGFEFPTKEQLLDTIGDFTWFWGCDWFIETKEYGNFHWIDSDYLAEGCVSIIKPFNGDIKEFCNAINIEYGRDKGLNLIRNKCGTEWKFEKLVE